MRSIRGSSHVRGLAALHRSPMLRPGSVAPYRPDARLTASAGASLLRRVA